MSNPQLKDKIKNGILNSEKWKKVIEDKRIGNYKQIKHTEEAKTKISESLKKYHASNVTIVNNINVKRDNKLGTKIKQYDMNNNLLNEYTSISEASRKTSVPKSSLLVHLKDNTKTGGGFIWKYA
jgi:hypothetical protein